MDAGRRCRAAYGVLRRPDRGRHRLEPVQATAEPRSVTLPGRSDRLLGYPGEPVQPHPQERPGTRIAAVHVGQRDPAGGPGFSHYSAGCLAHLGRGRCQLAFAAREHPQPQQIGLAALLMILYFLGGSQWQSPPFGYQGALIPWLPTIRVQGTMVLIMASADPERGRVTAAQRHAAPPGRRHQEPLVLTAGAGGSLCRPGPRTLTPRPRA